MAKNNSPIRVFDAEQHEKGGRVIRLFADGSWILHDYGENIKITEKRAVALLLEIGYSHRDIMVALAVLAQHLVSDPHANRERPIIQC